MQNNEQVERSVSGNTLSHLVIGRSHDFRVGWVGGGVLRLNFEYSKGRGRGLIKIEQV